MKKNYCVTSALVFVIVAVLHALRFLLDVPLHVGAWEAPRGFSGIAAIGAAALAIWGMRSARAEPVQFTHRRM